MTWLLLMGDEAAKNSLTGKKGRGVVNQLFSTGVEVP
jgi:hypothetical protein